MRILVVDDEKLIVKGLKYSLEMDGNEVDCAYDGQEAIDCARKTEYDVVLLDLMLPVFSGYEVCQKIREFSEMPIIMLTAKGDDMDKIMGLEYGADDYITKPFNILEVKARIKAITRRSKRNFQAPEDNTIIKAGDVKIDTQSHRVYINDKEIRLTGKEFEILKFLVENQGKVYSREQLMSIIWGSKNPGDARTVDVNVRRLREKIEENPAKPKYVQTKWGMGYYFQA